MSGVGRPVRGIPSRMTLPTTKQALTWIGLPVHDTSGTAIGSCRNVFADDDSGVPEWVEVELPGGDVAFVPTLGASASGGAVSVAHALDVVERAPRFAGDVDLSPDAEKALYDHYGVAYSRERSDTLLPAAADLPGDADTTPSTPPAARLRRLETVSPPPPVVTATPPPAYSAPAPSSATPSSSLPLPLPVLAGAGAAAAAVLAVLAKRRRDARREVDLTPEQGGAAVGLAALLVAVGGLLARRRRRRRREDAEDATIVRLPGVTDHAGLTGVVPVDPVVAPS